MKVEDASSTVQIFSPLKVQHTWLDLLQLLKAHNPLSDCQLLPVHLLSALNIFHIPKVSQARNRSSR